ncbi:MAG: lysylphosphatidylglycerol synthase transmembrane domain-containing protein [Bacteroidota bacterium]
MKVYSTHNPQCSKLNVKSKKTFNIRSYYHSIIDSQHSISVFVSFVEYQRVINLSEVNQHNSEDHEILNSIKLNRILLPVFIGLAVVGYLLYRQFDPEAFKQISWTKHSLFWLCIAVICLAIRHLAYSYRLYILSDHNFSFRKCIELIFIWEFSSAVSPTNVGGSAVALFVLAQEKLTAAKTTSIVIYTVVLDVFFYISSLFIFFLCLGPRMIQANAASMSELGGLGKTFIVAYVFMAMYGSLFFYGLFFKPQLVKRFFHAISKWRIFRRFKESMIKLGDDFIVASKEMYQKDWKFHVKAFLATAIAWSSRYLLLSCLIVALVDAAQYDFATMFERHARIETMFVIMAFSPTPGGSGIAELVFGTFLSDYVPQGISVIIAFIWRLLTYYSYLIIGAIVIPNWIRNLINKRKKDRL